LFTKLTQKMIPFFSIAISVYNKASFVEQTLRSILNQSFSDFEIIIVDDGSTDNSLEVINTIKDNRISVYSIKNQGVAAARNYVLQKAKKEKEELKRAESKKRKSSSRRSNRQNPIVKVLSSPTVIRSVLGILTKMLK